MDTADKVSIALAAGSMLIAAGSLSADASGYARTRPVRFRRVTGGVLAALALAVGAFAFADLDRRLHQRAEPRNGLILVAVATLAVGLYRLLRIPRNLRDQDVVRIIRSADELLTVREGIAGSEHIVRGRGRLRNRGKERTGSLLRLLGTALDDARAPVMLLQGQTGSGKTTALRRWGRTRLPREKRAHSGVVLPVYVDLSRFAATDHPVDADAYRKHIAELLGRDDRFLRGKVMEFLEKRRDHIRWIFLFDAFDELPELATAESVKLVIERHLVAVRSLVETAPNLHAVIAARDFAGADVRLTWPIVDVLPLPVGSQRTLVRRFGLEAEDTRWLTRLIDGSTDTRLLSENPLLLTLLCSFVNDEGTRNPPPVTVTAMLERAIRARLAAALQQETGGTQHEDSLRDAAYMEAQRLAYRLTASVTMSGGPGPADISPATLLLLERAGLGVLQGVRPASAQTADLFVFAFRHRLLQDFLAAVYLTTHPAQVECRPMLTEAKWEQVTMLLLQLASSPSADALWSGAEVLLTEACERSDDVVHVGPGGLDEAEVRQLERFEWPSELITTGRVLRAGLRAPGEPANMAEIRRCADALVIRAFIAGTSYDRAAAVNVLPLTTDEVGQWAVDRLLTGDRIDELRNKALSYAATVELPPTAAGDRARGWLFLDAFLTWRPWADRPGSAERVPSGFATLPMAVLILAALTFGRAVAAAIWHGLGPPIWWMIVCVAAAVWAAAGGGKRIARPVVSVAVLIVAIAMTFNGLHLVGVLMDVMLHALWGDGRQTLISLLKLVLLALTAWPALSVAAVLAGADQRTAVFRPLGAVRDGIRRHWGGIRLTPRSVLIALLGSLAGLVSAVYLSDLVSVQADFSLTGFTVRATVGITFAVVSTLAILSAVGAGTVHDLRLLRRVRRRWPDPVRDDDLLRLLSDVQTERGLRWILDELDCRSREAPEVVQAATTLKNLDHAIEFVNRHVVVSSGRWRVPADIWESAPEFGQSAFVRWLRSPTTVHHTLRQLVQSHRRTVTELRQRGATAAAADESP